MVNFQKDSSSEEKSKLNKNYFKLINLKIIDYSLDSGSSSSSWSV